MNKPRREFEQRLVHDAPPPLDRDIVAMLTPNGRGAIATVQAVGAGISAVLEDFFRPLGKRRLTTDGSQHRFGFWIHGSFREEVVVRRSSDSNVEIHCHGGVVPAKQIMQSFVNHRFEAVNWAAWLAQQPLGTIEQEARLALANARTERTACILLDQLNGSLARRLVTIRDAIEAGGWDLARQALSRLMELAACGLHLTAPWRVVLAGPPNVGKSSLLNACLGYSRAIVYDEPGTTRDALHSITAIDGWPVQLSDTAGIRNTENQIEQLGVEISRDALESADMILWVVDLTQETSGSPPVTDEKCVQIVGSKLDLVSSNELSQDVDHYTSSLDRRGIPALFAAITTSLVPVAPEEGEAILFTERQESLVRKLLESCKSQKSAEALEVLDKLESGELA